MLDSDLAEMYQTETKYINRAMKRNPERFPQTFAFQLTAKEWENLRFQSGTLNAGRGQLVIYAHLIHFIEEKFTAAQ